MATLVQRPPVGEIPRLLSPDERYEVGRYYVNAQNVFVRPIRLLLTPAGSHQMFVERAYRRLWWIAYKFGSACDRDWTDFYCYRIENAQPSSWNEAWEIDASTYWKGYWRVKPAPAYKRADLRGGRRA